MQTTNTPRPHKNTLPTHNNGLSSAPCTFSSLQKSQIRGFQSIFSSEESVVAFFSPQKWSEMLANPDSCTQFPEMTLRTTDYFYRSELTSHIVVNNLVGLFSLARPRDPLPMQAVQMTAALFVGKFGNDLSMHGMLYFFANYLCQYKNSYGQFDLPDVLRQCDKVFLPWWRTRIGKIQQQNQQGNCKETGKPALFTYLRREYIAKGRDIRTSPLIQMGILSGHDIQRAVSGEEIPL